MKKILGLLGAIGLVASTPMITVVSCGTPSNEESSKTQLDILKSAIESVVKKDGNLIEFESSEKAIAAIEEYNPDLEKGLLSFGTEKPYSLNQIVAENVTINDNKATIYYKESKKDKSNEGQFIWGEEQKFDIDINIKVVQKKDFTIKKEGRDLVKKIKILMSTDQKFLFLI